MKDNPYISVLMYHEVAPVLPSADRRYMTPGYVVTAEQFEAQVRDLRRRGFQTLLPHEVGETEPGGKYVIITFDDGLEGNYTWALPILLQYGYRAMFFVVRDFIGMPRYVTWPQLEEVAAKGMSVQSHTVTHPALELLDDGQVWLELVASKRAIEERLSVAVDAISFPHGSYDDRVVRMAREMGYRYMFSSDVQRMHKRDFAENRTVLGRFAVTNKTSLDDLRGWVDGDWVAVFSAQARKRVKTALRKIIGVRNYSRLYQVVLGIKAPPREPKV